MNNGSAFLKAINPLTFGLSLLAASFVFAAPAMADEEKQGSQVEVVVAEEEFATEAIDVQVAGEKAPSATDKTDCSDNLNTTTKDPACTGNNN